MVTIRSHSVLCVLLAACFVGAPAHSDAANALETYVAQPDDSFAWHMETQTPVDGATVTQLAMTSQTWRGHAWSHEVHIIRPQHVRHPDLALLFIMGDHPGSAALLQRLADRAGAVAAAVTRVPNQPLFDGRREDALIAYTFDQYVRTGDDSWPALLPMTKSAVRAMDAVQAWARTAHRQSIEKFVVTGASKRGWTTWLTAAVDPRVTAIAPIVIDVLNMKAQTEWSEQVYGRQSDKLSDYTNLDLVDNMDTPRMRQLRDWVDPYSYRARYTMPKLLLLGTNDPYWTVDALRHYWHDLPPPKLVFQTPNGGHALGAEAADTLAVFVQMIADREALPQMEWHMAANGHGRLSLRVNRPAQAIHLWTANSDTRDFRKALWRAEPLKIEQGSSQAGATIDTPPGGYRAFMGEVLLRASTGHEYKLSTAVQVVPDVK